MANAFSFGSVRQQEKPKQNLQKFDSILKENYVPGYKYFLFLVDYVIDQARLDLLIKDIERAGILSYCIVSVISVKKQKDDSTTNLISLESNWRKYIEFNGTSCECIVAFGSAIRVLNKSADVNFYDFIDDKFNSPRYFCGSEFIGGPDKWIYPVEGIGGLYPLQLGNDPTNFLTRFFREKLRRIQKEDMSLKSLDMRDYEVKYIKTKEEVSAVLKSLMNSELLAADTETSGFHFIKDVLGTLQLSNDGEIGYVFDWENVDTRILRQVFKTAKRLTLANAKFDMKFLWQNGVTGWYPTDDTVLLSHAINSNRTKGLKAAAIFYCGKFTGYDQELDNVVKRLKIKNYLEIPKDVLIRYAGLDPIVTWRVQKALDKHVAKIDKKFPNEKQPEWTIERFYREVMMPNANMVSEVEIDGIYVDKAIADESERTILNKIKELKKELAKLWKVPEDFKFESTKELGQLFEKMKWPCIERSKAGHYATSDPVLVEYDRLGLPGIKELKELRSYNVALKTFINGWREAFVDHEDGTTRIHPNCHSFGTSSFRHAMSNPNLQQVPARGAIAPLIKKILTTPPEGPDEWLIVNADFRALQLVLAFADCGLNRNGVDPVAYDIYDPEVGCMDAHSLTAHNVFCNSVNLDIIEIEDEAGNTYIFGEDQQIKIRRPLITDSEELIIFGRDFQNTDEFLGYV